MQKTLKQVAVTFLVAFESSTTSTRRGTVVFTSVTVMPCSEAGAGGREMEGDGGREGRRKEREEEGGGRESKERD